MFAWTQNRLMLPAWLGAGTALQKVVEDGKQSELEAMCRDCTILLDASRHAGDGLRQSRPVAGGIL
ncbi:phosphoenolpyruvate carboxylase [Escherichia coli]